MKKRTWERSRLPSGIVVGVDENGLADQAILAGLDLGRRIGCPVELVHASPSNPPGWPILDAARSSIRAGEFQDKVRRAVVERLRNVVGRMTEPHDGDRAERATVVAAPAIEDLVRVIAGHPAQVILEEARRTSADVIFLGGHEKRRVIDFGSTARAVLSQAPVAVWVQACPVRPIRKILVPVDLSEESLSALATACSLARVYGARVRVIHCFERSRYVFAAGLDDAGLSSAWSVDEMCATARSEFEGTMREIEWNEVEHDADFIDGDPAKKILELSSSVDLVVLGTHGRTGFASAVLGNVAYSVLKRSDAPVLAIRHPERRFLA